MGKKVLKLDLKVPNQTRYLELVGRIGEDLARELKKEGEEKKTLAQHLNVVLTEAMANAIRHAHEDDPDKTVHIVISLSDEELMIRVYDHGPGFDFDSACAHEPEKLEEHGRGIYIIRSLMDTVVYRRTRDYNVLEMWKKLR
ncbi:MAG: ATP-binding protein [Geobacter sp.]|nr:MAG: ATP-binding protein [Geobacter sp.]